jgi:type II secretory pathway component GspD/PulD (secretin)
VRDYDVEIAQGAVVADPVVDVIRDGSILDVRPVVSADRRFITMELRPTVANLPRPIPTFQTSLGIGNDVILQLPELEVERARTTVTIPDGATLMLGGLKVTSQKDFDSGMPWLKDIPIVSFFFSRKGTLDAKRKLLILVRATIVIPTEREPVQVLPH